MEDKIMKILKSFMKIQPDAEFTKRSRRLVLAAPQNQKRFFGIRLGFFESIKLGAALTLASVLTFIVIGGISFFQLTKVSPSALTSFDSASLSTEASSFDFSIHLGEAKYLDDSGKQMAAVLDEVSQSKKSSEDIKKLLDEIVL